MLFAVTHMLKIRQETHQHHEQQQRQQVVMASAMQCVLMSALTTQQASPLQPQQQHSQTQVALKILATLQSSCKHHRLCTCA
jgi:hypothetical protein